VMPVPPFIWRSFGITFRRILPHFLAAERREIEITPDSPHRLIAAIVDEIGAENLVAVPDESVVAMPFVHSKIFVEAVGDGVPRHLPTHACLQTLDIPLGRARCEYESGVPRMEVSQVTYLISDHGTPPAGVIGPAKYSRFEKRAINDQLPA